ncbi:hypothetical protein BKA93DRAFT_584797 [Sparassis latifolia]
MGCVCHITRRAVQDYPSRRPFSNRFLTKFFADPLAFRPLQARTAIPISQSFGVHFFYRSFYLTCDLYLYPRSQHVREVGELSECEKCEFTPTLSRGGISSGLAFRSQISQRMLMHLST